VLADAGLAAEAPLGVGIGMPGEVHPTSGDVVRSPLPGWAAAGFAAALERHLRVPVLVDNDVNTLTVAEHLYGSGRGLDHLLVVSVGRGIGMGAVVDGVVARGARGALGEIGHVVVAPGGQACWCGRRGCLEAEAAEPAIVQKVLATLGRLVPPGELAAMAEEDARAAAILEAAGRTVGHAIAAAISLFDPQRTVVSGEGVRLGHHYLDGLRGGVLERLLPGVEPDLVFEPWGDEAWARGAASLVLRELFSPAHLRESGRPAGSLVTPRGEPPSVAAS
jgi:predicted NBD/HSP70 family sugar kinase